ncbi:Putative uncharacterized protein [Lactococcus lactis subsp. lactis A12]|uniref:Uncharacterized protein n=1 Tax=Lactococcus lactis subsp. lactis A12 TaxID=1137134 RepID=S6FRQ3_LACLL|nr:hypothetical protein [Lactococcus lactis]CDG03757.1 Putative uncharacterized protein [Lactococcus lactis subsp. lactis A12]
MPDYQSIVINSETGEVIAGALVNDETGRLVDGTVPEGVQAEVRSRPIDGTCVAYDVVVEAEGFGNQLEVTVPTAVSLDGLAYNQEIRFTGLSARHWSRTTRQLTNGRVSFVHTQGFKLRAENVEAVKVKADKK